VEGGGCHTFGPPTVTLFNRRGHIHSREARKKIGISKLGHKYNVGRPFRLKPGTRERITKLLIKFNRSRRGRRLKKKQMKGNQRAKGHHKTRGFRKRQSRTMKRRWRSAKYRETILKKRRKALQKKSYRNLVSQRFTNLWKDPKWRRKMMKARAK
jgi:hypothetical protein